MAIKKSSWIRLNFFRRSQKTAEQINLEREQKRLEGVYKDLASQPFDGKKFDAYISKYHSSSAEAASEAITTMSRVACAHNQSLRELLIKEQSHELVYKALVNLSDIRKFDMLRKGMLRRGVRGAGPLNVDGIKDIAGKLVMLSTLSSETSVRPSPVTS